MGRPKASSTLKRDGTGTGKKQMSLNAFVKGEPKVNAVPNNEANILDEDNDGLADAEDGLPGGKANKKASPDESPLPPISSIPSIFTDLTKRADGLRTVASHLRGRKLRVATMCSGTESPLLALDMISNAMGELYGEDEKLEVEHIFSCEIEPFKQAYIERNFGPPVLFRDVCELGGETATTAYGASLSVPGNADILIAGTSCVDYSTLNNEKQTIDAGGESGRTFLGMMSWVRKNRPPIVILENVCSAPWSRIVDYFDKIGYSATNLRVDTKEYYIPHTRTRGYLVAFDAKKSNLPMKWKDYLGTLKRPASSTLDAFLLPSDDPRIHSSRERLVKSTALSLQNRREKIDWGRCENRHTRARTEEELGNKRPLTSWSEGGGCKVMDFMWSDWGAVQVERVWDLLDITTLRRAKIGLDASFKTYVWNLSQNVDRQIDSSRVGISPCLTPSMIPYITNRGGPMVGLEALSLQGLPIDRLLLTRESEDNLADLAGNAMSTTVVGSAIISSLIVGLRLLKPGPDKRDDDTKMEGVNRVKNVKSEKEQKDLESRITSSNLSWSSLQLQPLSQSYSLSKLLQRAALSSRLCECEGRTGITTREIKRCKECGHTACSKCGGKPEHDVEDQPMAWDEAPRLRPNLFAKELKEALPMVVRFNGVDENALQLVLNDWKNNDNEALSNANEKRWRIYKDALLRCVGSSPGNGGEEFRFTSLKRSTHWIVSYRSSSAHMELTLFPPPGLPIWRLTIAPLPSDPANALSRKVLFNPAARLVVKGDDLLKGEWEFALPFSRFGKLSIKGREEVGMVGSYERRLGLTGTEFREKDIFSGLEVRWIEEEGDNFRTDRNIEGIYRLLDRCGTANSALHKRIAPLPLSEGSEQSGSEMVTNMNGVQKKDDRPLYFFLDPSRTGNPEEDSFVFSADTRRLEFKESRDLVGRLDCIWRQDAPINALEDANQKQCEVNCEVPYVWIECAGVILEAHSSESFYATPSTLSITASTSACASAQALLSCRVSLTSEPGPEWPRGIWVEVDSVREFEVFKATSFFMERVKHVGDTGGWHEIAFHNNTEEGGKGMGHYTRCERCSPVPPKIRWVTIDKKVRAVEDSSQAGMYERALKNRPAAFVTHIKYDPETNEGQLKLGVNLTSLIHRAASRLPLDDNLPGGWGKERENMRVYWKLDTDFTPKPAIDLAKFTLKSNRPDPPSAQPPHFKKKMPLRPEQLRSLDWMIKQESDDSQMFVEEEICEAILPTLGWRGEGRAERGVRIKGGVLADQVGYGKTAITLGLIDSTFEKAEDGVRRKEERGLTGYIPVKATLVVVPGHLTRQWASEVSKFLGSYYTVEVIHTSTQLNSCTVSSIQNADVVVVASNLFHSDVYLRNIEAFAAGEDLPNKEGRYFNARWIETLTSLKKQVEKLKEEGASVVLKEIKEASERNVKKENDFIQKKRLKGRQYRAANDAQPLAETHTNGENNSYRTSPDVAVGKAETDCDVDDPISENVANGKHTANGKDSSQTQPSGLKVEVVVDSLARFERKNSKQPQTQRSTKRKYKKSDTEKDSDTESDVVMITTIVRNGVNGQTTNRRRAARSNRKKSIIIHSGSESEGDEEASDYEATASASTSSAAVDWVSSSESEFPDASEDEIDEKPKGKGKKKAAGKEKYKAPSRARGAKGKSNAVSSEDEMDVDEVAAPSQKSKGKGSTANKKRKSDATDGSDSERPAKKAKKEPKPKVRRVDTDPWKLKTATVQRDWCNMQAPPLEMFHFNRLVIDEFTYLQGRDQFIVNNIQSTCRWILSGTPPVADFGAIKSIASFMGIHLGVDDDGEGSKSDMAKRKREQTDVEKFHSFREVRSLEWHAHRQTVGQRFLDQFVRQNIAETDEIPFEEKPVTVHLPASERAIYLELEHHLRALDMTIKKARKSESDRERRLNQSLGESKSAEEALLKRCSHFDLVTTEENAMKACAAIVHERETQLSRCKEDLLKHFKKALQQQSTLKAKAGRHLDESHFEAFLRGTVNEGLGEEEATAMVLDLFVEAGGKVPEKEEAAKVKAKQTAADDLPSSVKDLVWEHREHTHEVRRIVKELVARKRSLRFFTAVRDLQRDQNDETEDSRKSYCCPGCGKSDLSTDEIGVLSSCGHMGCLTCIRAYSADREACVADKSAGCRQLTRFISIVEAKTLGVDDIERDGKGKHFGRKLEQIIDLIKNQIPSEERVLVFVQFDDLMKKVGEALHANGVDFLEIRGSASAKSKALENFQNDSKERVLLLHVTDESASGANLTGANHAVFISPLLTVTQEDYVAFMTQAVGRLRRFGQLKLVHIYHFLSKDTIDFEIYHKRTAPLAN